MFPEQKRTLKHYKSLMNVCWNSQNFPAGYRRPKKPWNQKPWNFFKKPKNLGILSHGSMDPWDQMTPWNSVSSSAQESAPVLRFQVANVIIPIKNTKEPPGGIRITLA